MLAFLFITSATILISIVLLRNTPSAYRKDAILFSVVFLIASMIITILYHIELNLLWQRETLWGDATEYWNAAKKYSEQKVNTYYNPVYYIFLSWFYPYSLLARFAQVFIAYLTSLIIVLTFNKDGYISTSNSYLRFFFLLNFGLFGTVAQFQKDTLVLILTMVSILPALWLKYARKNHIKFILFLVQFLSVLLIYDLRLWQFPVILVSILVGDIIALSSMNLISAKNVFLIGILVSFSLVVFLERFNYSFWRLSAVGVLEGSMLESSGQELSSRNFLSIVKLFFGPGFIRPLFPKDYFWYFTYVYVTCYYLATIVWYINMFVIFCNFRFRNVGQYLKKPIFVQSLIVVLSYSLMYGSAYGGTGGMRQRMIIQTLATILGTVVIFKNNSKLRFPPFRVFIVLSVFLLAQLLGV